MTCVKFIWDAFRTGACKRSCDRSGLRAGYATGDVLQGVSIHVDAGEIVGVLGRNGVGKTTLMRALIGLLPARDRQHPLPRRRRDAPQSGCDARRRGIGYVPQGREVFPHIERLRQPARGWRSSWGPKESLGSISSTNIFPSCGARQSARRHSQRWTAGNAGHRESPGRRRPRNCCCSTTPSDGVQPSIVARNR